MSFFEEGLHFELRGLFEVEEILPGLAESKEMFSEFPEHLLCRTKFSLLSLASLFQVGYLLF